MDIPSFTRKLLDEFDSMRGKHMNKKFWDMVVITASDEEQANAYDQQIKSKQIKLELPLGVEYKVYSDPPGPKIGCGGSTMYVINQLHELLGKGLWSKRVLLINAGGQSQRLPSSSVLGKIFMSLPIRNPMYQLFEFKLACYLPFLKTMKPGIFHAAADTVEVYDLGADSDISFDKPGFTALAHPSSLEIGRTHGVYVLEEHSGNFDKIASMRNCLEVLQKPSVERMIEKGAVLKDSSGKEIVYTDSCFFFDHSVTQKLLNCYREEPVTCEIDAYGDFLQGLGPRATDSYTFDVKNVSKVEADLVKTRKRVFNCLNSTQLNIVALEASKFYHFGTMPEYLENLTNDPVIASELGYQNEVFSVVSAITSCGDVDAREDSVGIPVKKRKTNICNEGCVMHSVVGSSNSIIGRNSVVEYSDFEVPIHINKSCIISNCQLLSQHSSKEKLSATIPDYTFLHTTWVQYEGKCKAVTIALGTGDNVKQKTSKDNLEELELFGKSFPIALKTAGIKEPEFSDDTVCCLWTAKMFMACDTMSESFHATYSAFFCESEDAENMKYKIGSHKLLSLQDVVRYKDVDRMLKYRNELYEKITLCKEQKVSKI